MQQPQGKRGKIGQHLFLIGLLIYCLVIAAFLGPIQFYNKQSSPEPPPVTPSPPAGSISENVEGIQISLMPENVIPEFSVGGTLTGVLTCLASFAIFILYKKRSR